MKSVIVALSSTSCGDLKSIFTVPPLQNNSEVVGFRIVATWDKGNEQKGNKLDCFIIQSYFIFYLNQYNRCNSWSSFTDTKFK